MGPLYSIQQDADPMDHDFLVVSINSTGAPGNLNRAVMKRAGYPEEELPHEDDLRSGYHLLDRPDHKPILFVVVNPEGSVGEELHHNLYRGLLTYIADLAGKRVWLPLLGTGAGRLAYAESLALTTRVIESLMGETNTGMPQFNISVPGTEEGLALLKEHGVESSKTLPRGDGMEATRRGHWLIKMDASWKEELLTGGKTISIRPKDFQDSFGDAMDWPGHPLKPTDHAVLFLAGIREHSEMHAGYPGDYLWGEAEVAQMEMLSFEVRLKVVRTFYQPIPLHRFKNLVPDHDVNLKPSTYPVTFIQISEETYNTILALEESPFVNRLLPFYLTEGNHRETQDQLDFEADIDAFAAVIRQKDVKPPLAIGLFGNWGSGKSFFMEKLEHRIAHPTDWNYPEYVQHVVPVRFNSWHYSDANLWASMIMHIFGSLNDYAKKTKAAGDIQSIYAKLNVTKEQIAETKQQLEAKEAEVEALKMQQTSVEEALRKTRKTLDNWTVPEIVKAVFQNDRIREDLADLNAELGTKPLTDNIDEMKARLAEMAAQSRQQKDAWSALVGSRRGKWWLVLIIAGIVALVCWAAVALFKGHLQEIIGELTAASTALLSIIAGVWAVFARGVTRVRAVYGRLKSLVDTVEQHKSKLETEQEAAKQGLQDTIDSLTAEKNALAQQQAQAEATKEALEQELVDIASGKRLGDFLAGRSTDDAYARQLGIVSWIRKDFEELNRHFEEQRAEREKGKATDKPQLQIDRIVLYIDDLDRCNEDVVVKVLEAIHLLLAFPLFVVVVGVDPRWLNNALSEKYKTLFGAKAARSKQDGRQEQDEEPVRGAATSYDYLEKIFQIPFALKPMNKDGREKLIAYLAEERSAKAEEKKGQQENVAEVGAVASNADVQASEEAATESLPAQSNAAEEKASAQIEGQAASEHAVAPAPRNPKEKLTISAEELAYMQQLSELFAGTPRTVNRYVNIYRIIKAHGGLQVAGPYERDEFLPILFLLAVVVGYPGAAEEFLSRVEQAKDTQTCGDFVDGCGIGPLREAAMPLLGDLKAMHVRYLKKNLPLVARFSFRTLMRRLA